MKAKIIWFTGLSGSGKTTLANLLYGYLKKNKNKKIKKIDGDIFRKKSNFNSFTKKNIIKNNFRIIKYIESITSKYNVILVSVISPILKTRKIANEKFKNYYYEIYTKCSLKKLVKRDPKGLYNLASQNKIKNLIGYNSKINYEKSSYKILSINTGLNSKKECLRKILTYIM
tara:strand:- start:414 stop:929 length:516 start_codon:yes stop_codon:yes gene_type:complete